MTIRRVISICVLVFATQLGLISALTANDTGVTIVPLADHIYELQYDVGYPVKVVASVGENGLLLVDAGLRDRADGVKAALATLYGGAPTFIVSTHVHRDHTGANHVWGTTPIIIGHKKLRSEMCSGIYRFDHLPDASLPDISISDTTTIHFNGEDIVIFPVPPSHTDNDLIVWFTGSNIACVGAVCNGDDFPSASSAGTIMNFAPVTKSIIQLLPEETKIVPGHGADCTLERIRQFYNMLIGTADTVASCLASGMSVGQMQEDSILAAWSDWAGASSSLDDWIEGLASGLAGTQRKEDIWDLMYFDIQNLGAEAAINHYFALQAEHADTYEFGEDDLLLLGYKLFDNDRIDESIPFIRRYLLEYPDGKNRELAYNYLAGCYDVKGLKSEELECYKAILEINPANTKAAAKVSELER